MGPRVLFLSYMVLGTQVEVQKCPLHALMSDEGTPEASAELGQAERGLRGHGGCRAAVTVGEQA